MVKFKDIYEKYDGKYGHLVEAYVKLDEKNSRLSKRISRMERESREQENEIRGFRKK
ncbi:hypothetical protein ES703_119805 [subsurface metagenome]